MSKAAQRPVSGADRGDHVDLVCSSGHVTTHSLARLVRLNDGWCGRCGADIDYPPPPAALRTPAGQDNDQPNELGDGKKNQFRKPEALAPLRMSDGPVAIQQEETQDDVPPAP